MPNVDFGTGWIFRVGEDLVKDLAFHSRPGLRYNQDLQFVRLAEQRRVRHLPDYGGFMSRPLGLALARMYLSHHQHARQKESKICQDALQTHIQMCRKSGVMIVLRNTLACIKISG